MTDTPAELLRQLHEDERVLWHARPRFLRLKQRLRQLLATSLLAWFIAFLGRHSHGCMVETSAKALAGILLAIPACQLVRLLWYLFTTSQTHYILTNHRALISRGALLDEYPVSADMLAKVETHGNGNASVLFTLESGESGWQQLPITTGKGFHDTPDADTLLKLLSVHAQATAPRHEALELDRKTWKEYYRQQSRKGNLVLFICGILFGIFCLGVSITEISRIHHLNSTGIHTTARVLAFFPGEKTGAKGLTLGHIIYLDVMFRDADGVPHTIILRCRNGEDTRYFTPGASLPLVYPAQHPEKAQLTLPWEQYHKCIWSFIWAPLAPVCAWQILIWGRARQALKTSTCNPS